MYRLGNLVTVGLLLALTTHAFAKGHAVDVAINGIGPPVDNAAFRTVQQVIGHAIAEGLLDEFVVTGYGIEGGYSACAEAAPHTTAAEFRTFVRQLRSIVADPSTTAYQVKLTQGCTAEHNVACTLEAKVCPDGSEVGRVPPLCRFAPCP